MMPSSPWCRVRWDDAVIAVVQGVLIGGGMLYSSNRCGRSSKAELEYPATPHGSSIVLLLNRLNLMHT